MNRKITKLEVAISVLLESGLPMHYEQVAKVALSKGLEGTCSSSLYVSFNAVLNREVRHNPKKVIRKLRPGVFQAIKES